MEILREDLERKITVSVDKLEINLSQKKIIVSVLVCSFDNEVENISKRRTVKLVADNTTTVSKIDGTKNPQRQIKNPTTGVIEIEGLTAEQVCGEYDFYINLIENTTFTNEQILNGILQIAASEGRFN